jgi:hypothetical protein
MNSFNNKNKEIIDCTRLMKLKELAKESPILKIKVIIYDKFFDII